MAPPVPAPRVVSARAARTGPRRQHRTGSAAPGGPPDPTAVLVGLLLGWCALACGIAAKDGRYGAWAMTAVLAGWAVVAVTVALLGGRSGPARRVGWPMLAAARLLGRPPRELACYALAAVVGLGPVLRHPRYYGAGPFAALATLLAEVAGLLAAAGIAGAAWSGRPSVPAGPAPPRATQGLEALLAWLTGRQAFCVVLTLAVSAGICTVLAAPDPRIDVFHLLQDSAAGLPHGVNMYHQQWATGRPGDLNGGLIDVYPYLPATTLLLAPFRLVVGDVRFGLLAALVVAVGALRALMTRTARPHQADLAPGARLPGRPAGDAPGSVGGGPAWMPALPLLVLVFPESLYALEQSWTEPLLVACLAVMVWAVCAGHGRIAVVAFAAALASKQHIALLVPVAAGWPAFGPRRTAAACAVGLGVVSPWVLDDPRAFVHDAIRTNLGYPVLNHSLSVPGWAHHFGIDLGFALTLVALAGAYLLAWWARGDAVGYAAGSALVLLTMTELNKQSFFNHYTLPMALLVIAVAAGHRRDGPPERGQAGIRIAPGLRVGGERRDPRAVGVGVGVGVGVPRDATTGSRAAAFPHGLVARARAGGMGLATFAGMAGVTRATDARWPTDTPAESAGGGGRGGEGGRAGDPVAPGAPGAGGPDRDAPAPAPPDSGPSDSDSDSGPSDSGSGPSGSGPSGSGPSDSGSGPSDSGSGPSGPGCADGIARPSEHVVPDGGVPGPTGPGTGVADAQAAEARQGASEGAAPGPGAPDRTAPGGGGRSVRGVRGRRGPRPPGGQLRVANRSSQAPS